MNSFVCVFVVALAVAAPAIPLPNLSKEELESHTWVLLAAGANGWENYRMQADICHSYQVFHNFGVPDERIIVMMYDDIAYDPQNPYPGKIINDIGGEDVYAGVPHDYTGKLVTAQNFLLLMTGESVPGGNKTLQSTADDNVIIHYSDHGGVFALCFPGGAVTKKQLQQAVDTMVEKQMFKNLIFYVDACFSGSMFYTMKIPPNMYAATAAPVGEYAYGCSYDNNLGNFPCDQFSHYWLTDLEQNDQPGYTWNDDFTFIQENCHFSQTCRYGDVDTIGPMGINDLFATDVKNYVPGAAAAAPFGRKDSVSQVDIPLALAQHRYEKSPTEENSKKLAYEISIRKAVDAMANRIVEAAKPGFGTLGITPCQDNCDESCPCYDRCLSEHDHDVEHCRDFCCNEEYACTKRSHAEINETCLETLSVEYMSACGNDHAYLRKPDSLFYRLCKSDKVNLDAAVAEIRKQCGLFKKSF